MRHLLLISTLATLGTPVLGFGIRGAAERIYYYDAYRADELFGGTQIAPGCVGTMPNYRCNFEQFLAYIWTPLKGDTDPPPAPRTPKDMEFWGLTRVNGVDKAFEEIKLGDLVHSMLDWSSPVLKYAREQDIKVFESDKETFAAAMKAYGEQLKKYKAGQLDVKPEKPPKPKSMTNPPKEGGGYPTSKALTLGIDYSGKLFPSIPSRITADDSYYYTIRNIGEVLLQKPPSDKEDEFNLIKAHAIKALKGIYDLRIQDTDQPDFRPLLIAQEMVKTLTKYDWETIRSHIVIDPSGDTEDICTKGPISFSAQPGENIDKGRRGGINFDASAAAISAFTRVEQDTIHQLMVDGDTAYRAIPQGAAHFRPLESVAYTLSQLGSPVPATQFWLSSDPPPAEG